MGVAVGQAAPPVEVPTGGRLGQQTRGGLRYLGRNRQLLLGIILLSALALFVILGHLFYNTSHYRPLSVPGGRAPSAQFPLGQGMWWWFLPPIIVIIVLFMGLFGLSAGLDEIANPRLRKTV